MKGVCIILIVLAMVWLWYRYLIKNAKGDINE